MRVLGLAIESPQTVVNRGLSDLAAIARAARAAPRQLDRLLALGEEIAAIGYRVLEIAERLDARAGSILELGERIDMQAAAMVQLGERIDSRGEELIEMGAQMRDLGAQIDSRGEEIVDRATGVVETGAELIAVMPTFERALAMATPLEGAIDRFGRLVDRLPGGTGRGRSGVGEPSRSTASSDQSTDPPAPPPDP